MSDTKCAANVSWSSSGPLWVEHQFWSELSDLLVMMRIRPQEGKIAVGCRNSLLIRVTFLVAGLPLGVMTM